MTNFKAWQVSSIRYYYYYYSVQSAENVHKEEGFYDRINLAGSSKTFMQGILYHRGDGGNKIGM